MAKQSSHYDVAIIGAGAAGLFCAGKAAAFGKSTILIDHRKRVAEKIRISGGGRCNFTNIHSGPDNFLSQNAHFAKSALAGYSPYDFIDLVERYRIRFHEKKLGQLFCDDSAQNIIDMLIEECRKSHVTFQFETAISAIAKDVSDFTITTDKGVVVAKKLVIATGGLSIPKIGATGFGYDVAKQFNLPVIKPRAGLVPLTFTDNLKALCADLAGLSVEAAISFQKISFEEGLLFTHRGLSGPSILQISSYWEDGKEIAINMMPNHDVTALLMQEKQASPKQDIETILAKMLPKRLATGLCDIAALHGKMADMSDKKIRAMAELVQNWQVNPNGSEGYRTAEVTLGGIDTNCLSSKDMSVKTVPGLYFIGEVVDVTGHLGGHNFQWAWASAHAAAKSL